MTREERAVTALLPFVQAWHLPLNPENMDLIVDAVLEAIDNEEYDYDEVLGLSEAMIEGDAAAQRRTEEKMRST